MQTNYWQTQRIRLRAIEPDDADTIYHWNLDSVRAGNLDFIWPPQSLDSVKVWAEEQSRKKFENGSYHWIIETLDCSPLGTISTHHCDSRNGTFSYGVDIAEEQRGKDYAGEAIWLVLRYYFEEFRYQKATIEIHVDNLSSLKLHQKLGFQQEGCLRRMHFSQG